MSWMGDDETLQQLEDAVNQKMAVKDTTVLVEGPLCTAIALLTVALFWWLGKHKKAKHWFAPRAGADRSFYEMFRATDYELMRADSGHNKEPLSLDFVLGMKFYRLIRDVTLISALFAFCITIPVTIFGGVGSANDKISSADAFSQGLVTAEAASMLSLTISDVNGNNLWAYIASSSLIVLSSCAIIWWHCEQALALKRAWVDQKNCCNPEQHHRTLLVFETPLEVESTFALLRGMLPFKGGTTPRDREFMIKLFQQHDLPKPTFTHGFYLKRNPFNPLSSSYLQDAITKYNSSIIQLENLLCDSNPPRRSLEDLLNDISTAEKEVSKRQRHARKMKESRAQPYWFLTFDSVYAAYKAYAVLSQGHSTLRGHVYKAPAAKDLVGGLPHTILKRRIWDNLALTTVGVIRRKALGWLFFCGLTVVFSVPVALVTMFLNIEILATQFSWAKSLLELNPAIAVAVVGALPPVIMAFVISVLLPSAFEWVSKYEGSNSKSGSERGTFRRCFAFLSFYFLFCFVSFSQIIKTIVAWKSGELKESSVEVWDFILSLSSSYITSSNYWLIWLPMKVVTVLIHLLLGLKQTVAEMSVKANEKITPRQALQRTKPARYEEGYLTATALLECTVGLVYAPIAPCVTVLAGLVLCGISAVTRFQLVFICEDDIDSGGLAWPTWVYRLLAALGMMLGLSTFMIYLRSKSIPMLGTDLGLLAVLLMYTVLLRRRMNAAERYVPEHTGTTVDATANFAFLHPLLNSSPRPLTRLWLTPDGRDTGASWRDEGTLTKDQTRVFTKILSSAQVLSADDLTNKGYSALKSRYSDVHKQAQFERDLE